MKQSIFGEWIKNAFSLVLPCGKDCCVLHIPLDIWIEGSMSEFIWILAIVIAIGAGLVGLTALFFILSSFVSATANILGFFIGAFLQLIISTLLDIRFLALFVIIFTILAGYEGDSWRWLSFSSSVSLFFVAASYILMFVLKLFNVSIFSNLGKDERERQFWMQLENSIFLNIGFLGIVYIVFAFCAVSYNYFLLSTMIPPAVDWVFSGPSDVVFRDFATYTFQTIIESLPGNVERRFGISVSRVTARQDAYVFNAFVSVFQLLFYAATASLIGAIWKSGRDKNFSLMR